MKDGILTHNHPGGTTFSPDDVHIAVKADLKEIRAVHKDGAYSLTKVANVPQSEVKFSNDYTDAINTKILSMSKNIGNRKTFNKQEQAEINKYRSNWLKNNASNYGYSYKEETI